MDNSQGQDRDTDEMASSMFSSENSEQCFLCYRHSNFNLNEKLLTVSKGSIYKSCCEYINREYFTEDFFNWNETMPLPFCKKCINTAHKLSRMNKKLEEIKALINKFVDAFTNDFLNVREKSNSGEVLYDSDASPNLIDQPPDQINSVKQERVECDNLESEYITSDPLDNFSVYDSTEDADIPEVDVKPEIKFSKPISRQRGRKKKSVSNAKKLRRDGKRGKYNTKRNLSISHVNQRRLERDDEGNPLPDALPRRKAAVKAEATISGWNDNTTDENTRGSSYDNYDEQMDDDNEQIYEENVSSPENEDVFANKPKRLSHPKYKSRKINFATTKVTLKIYNSSERRFKCKQCDKAYKNRHHLLEHELTHDKSRRFQCTMCDMNYSYIRNLRKHILKHGPDGSFIPLKRQTSERKPNRQSSTGTHKIRSYICKVCEKICNTAGQLFYHSQSHKTDQGEFKCDLCLKVFKNAVTFQKHGRIHTGENKFLCSICGKEFKSRSGQKDHELIHKVDSGQIDRRAFECPICHKLYSSKSSLNKHSFRHNEEKLFACTLCNKRFATKAGLATHGIYHKGERPFLCEECGKSFFTKTKLKEHNRIHTGNLFPCEYCEKGFQTTTHLKQHYRSHEKKMNTITINNTKQHDEPQLTFQCNNIKPVEPPQLTFQCFTCEQFFDSQSSLTNHVVIHTDEIPCYPNYDRPEKKSADPLAEIM